MRKIFSSALLVFLTTLSACSYRKKTVPDRKDSVPFSFCQSAVEEIRAMHGHQYAELSEFSTFVPGVSRKKELIVNVDELQAKYADVPFHFDLIPIAHKCLQDVDTIQLCYETEIDFAVVSLFYSNEMERLGWQQAAIFEDSDEALLIFRKPERLGAVSVRCRKSGYLIKRKKMVEIILFVEKERS